VAQLSSPKRKMTLSEAFLEASRIKTTTDIATFCSRNKKNSFYLIYISYRKIRKSSKRKVSHHFSHFCHWRTSDRQRL